ncbi:acetylornithine/succinyldiaminopimelate/putrescine aminotransferase [Streptomyces sp. SAI-149]|nr:acetylornithine/succinyldiaminopimelate/putrescine aminotransferase [Streptomyces sp. SAI-119]MDH6497803.1 acetylornithine/succinyldiaminopimelate/putrescine aminotransferase [Streptomyces sp. SAI-149]
MHAPPKPLEQQMSSRDPGAVVRRHSIGTIDPHAPVVTGMAGARMETADGGHWFDASTGGFGAGHPEVTAAIAEQAGRVALSSRILLSRPLAEAVEALDAFCPDPLTVSYLCNSGGEALDSALKLAKGTHPDRSRVLGIAGENFGTLTHGQGLSTGATPVPVLPLMPVTVSGDRPESLLEQVDATLAAVVLAPAAPGRPLERLSPQWWRALRDRCTQHDVLLILDERLTAPARLGWDLATQALGIVPDALILGEALGADAVPVGVMVTSRAAYDRVYAGKNPSLHGSTFGANPLSAAAVRAVLAVVAADGLADRQRRAEDSARRVLGDITSFGAVTEFCADGGLVWLRLASAEQAQALTAALGEARILVRPPFGPDGDVVAVLPPLTADPADLEQIHATVRAVAEEILTVREVAA